MRREHKCGNLEWGHLKAQQKIRGNVIWLEEAVPKKWTGPKWIRYTVVSVALKLALYAKDIALLMMFMDKAIS
jgi:hypothetical protein